MIRKRIIGASATVIGVPGAVAAAVHRPGMLIAAGVLLLVPLLLFGLPPLLVSLWHSVRGSDPGPGVDRAIEILCVLSGRDRPPQR